MITEFAPAKVNLALHVTGRRADGYHLLDSLVVFAGVGDSVTVAPSDRLTLAITGPQAAALPVTDDNLVLRAARAFGAGRGAAITLEKVLPVASGIGGGSADAAATLRALSHLWALPMPGNATVLALGADVPVCLQGRPARMTGVGDGIAMLTHPLPSAWCVLVNPHVAVPTPAVFEALKQREHPPLPAVPHCGDVLALADWLRRTRSDLEDAALQIAPAIAPVKAAIGRTQDCLIARMSGSGATCFGLYATADAATAAANMIRHNNPHWWVTDAPLLP